MFHTCDVAAEPVGALGGVVCVGLSESQVTPSLPRRAILDFTDGRSSARGQLVQHLSAVPISILPCSTLVH